MKNIAKYFDDMLDREMDRIFGSCTNAVENPSPPLTAPNLMELMDKAWKELEEIRNDPVPLIGANLAFCGGIRIIESDAAVRRERIRTYPKRKAKSPGHWMRMDKKWRKRYGFREVPQAYFLARNAVMRTPAGLVIHPSQVGLIRNFKAG